MTERSRSIRFAATALAALFVLSVVMPPAVASAAGAYFLRTWGSAGTGNGQFDGAHNVTVDDDGNVYACDINNSRIQKFTTAGTYVTKWGSNGSSNGQFRSPRGVSCDGDGDVFVADSSNNRVQKFSPTGTWLANIGTSGTGRLSSPHSVAFDASDNIYVSDAGNDRIVKFNSSGTYVAQYGTSGTGRLSGPKDLVVDGSGNIWVCDGDNERVVKYNSSGVYQSAFGSSGTGNGQFREPHGIAISPSGTIFVSDGINNDVQAFNSSGTFLYTWGSTGSATGQFRGPTGLACDDDGNVYVADEDNDRIQVFGVDATAPSTTSDAPEGWQSKNVSVTLTATDTGSGVASTHYKLGAAGLATYATPVQVSSEGTSTLLFYSVDAAGNKEATNTATVLIDKSAPVTTDDAPDGWATEAFTVKLVATDPYSGVAYSEYRLNGGDWTPGASIAIAVDGTWLIDYRSVDNVGNTEETRTATVLLDTEHPDLTVEGVEDGAAYNTDVAPTGSSTDPSATVTATLNGDPFKLGDTVTEEGVYTLVVTSTDPAGNKTTETLVFVIDKTAPDVAIEGVSDGSYYDDTVYPDASSKDPSATVAATLDDEPFTLGDPVADEGEYAFVAVATDPAGNSATATADFVVDLTPPSGTMSLDDGAQYTRDLGVSVDSDVEGADEMRIDEGTGFGKWFDFEAAAAATLPAVQGEATVTVQYRDKAGNELELSDTIIVDTVAPDLTIDGVTDGATYNKPVTPTVSSSDPEAVVVAKLGDEEFASGTTVEDDGAYALAATATDPAGNETSAAVGFEIDATAPQIDVVGVEQDGSYNTTVTPDAACDDGDAKLTATLNGEPFELCGEVGDEGSYELVVQACDDHGNEASTSVSFDVDRTAPDVTILNVADGGYYTEPVMPNASSSDASATFTATLNGAPFTLGSVLKTDGEYTFAATATDRAGNSSTDEVTFVLDIIAVDSVGSPTVTGSAATISSHGFKKAGTIILVRDDDFADGLVATGLSRSYGAPLLLTDGSTLSSKTRSEIKRLGAKQAIIVGGTLAVRPKVESSLKGMHVKVTRIGGKNRYETSALVAKRIQKRDGSRFTKRVIVANGGSYANSLAAVPLAAELKAPILLVKRGSADAAVTAYAKSVKWKQVVVLGPTGSVSNAVARKVAVCTGGRFTRLGGSSRYATADAVNRYLVKVDPSRVRRVGLACGSDWSWAVCGGVSTARAGGLMHLVTPTSLTTQTQRFLHDNAGRVDTITGYGNGTTPTAKVLGQARDAAMARRR